MRGWKHEPVRHSLAARGIQTKKELMNLDNQERYNILWQSLQPVLDRLNIEPERIEFNHEGSKGKVIHLKDGNNRHWFAAHKMTGVEKNMFKDDVKTEVKDVDDWFVWRRPRGGGYGFK